jgi:LacI family transcriptional regulator
MSEQNTDLSYGPGLPAVTIHDVARAAGVSASTVSRALSGKIPVRPETLRRILTAADHLHYSPSLLAQGLKSGRSLTIGLLVPDITNPVFPAIALGAETEAVRCGYQVFLAHSHERADQEEQLSRMLIRHRVAGLLIASACRGEASPADWIDGDVPVCQLVRRQTDRLPSVTVDQILAGRLAAEHLRVIGRRHAVILCGDQSLALHRERVKGFAELFAAIPGNTVRVIDSSRSDEDGVGVTQALLDQTETGQNLDCIFAASDMQALGVMRALSRRGIRVPDRIAVIGVDNLGISALCTPSITCIRQPLQEIGRLGCRLLLDCLEKPSADRCITRHDRLPCSLSVGESTVGLIESGRYL